jgi:hypothetical protein
VCLQCSKILQNSLSTYFLYSLLTPTVYFYDILIQLPYMEVKLFYIFLLITSITYVQVFLSYFFKIFNIFLYNDICFVFKSLYTSSIISSHT